MIANYGDISSNGIFNLSKMKMVHYVIMERNILERLATRTLPVCQTILINMKKNNVKPTFNKLLSYK